MKTKFILLCAATAVLTACAKTEVTPEILNQDAEITFLTAPVTKATQDFSTDNVFQSAAFYTVNNFEYGTAETYIDASPVKYFTSVWKVATGVEANATAIPYYWPKDGGKLSFFSWSLNNTTLKYGDGSKPAATITSANGVKLVGYKASANNDDFMVADSVINRTKNVNPAKYKTEGVPTLFKHKTAKVAFKVVTNGDYTAKPLYQKFTVTSIDFVNVATEGTYTQYDASAETANKEAWTTTTTGTLNYFTGSQEVKYNEGEAQDVVKTGTELYIPETYLAEAEDGHQTLQVKYTVSRENGNNESSKDYTANICLKNILENSITSGKVYVITLKFGLDEILWDPAIYDWEDGATGSADIQ